MVDPVAIKQKFGANYYAKIGAMGGKKSRKGGFYVNRELAREAGRKGGHASSRKGIPNKKKE